MGTQTFLDQIIRWKRDETKRRKTAVPLEALQAEATSAPRPRDFAAALRAPHVSLIAEIKKASPSKGLLCPDLNPVALAQEYEANGAAAISVLTDEHYFQGSLDHLRAVRQHVRVPVLRKDFILEPYQVYEARTAGADAVLLIVAALSDGDLQVLYQLIESLGMAALVEVHSTVDLVRALKIGPRIIGANNRDLHSFEVSLEVTARLRPLVPASMILVSESGIHDHADVAQLAYIGVDAILVGEALVRAQNLADKVRELIR